MKAEVRENVKLGLLALITITVMADVFYFDRQNDHEDQPMSNVAITPPASSPNNSPIVQPIDQHNHQQETVDNTPKTSIAFEETEYNFGDIYQDTQNEHIFKFKNNGQNPLIIKSANGSCGCTVPEYPKEPIPPGGTGEIKVVYSPGKQENQQTKTVTIVANTEPSTIVLTIKANVKKK